MISVHRQTLNYNYFGNSETTSSADVVLFFSLARVPSCIFNSIRTSTALSQPQTHSVHFTAASQLRITEEKCLLLKDTFTPRVYISRFCEIKRIDGYCANLKHEKCERAAG